ncbi:hypothetical protein HUG20_08505 [Salicibibacter cibi]|uniref:Uncharacterized protein n=1 Tax=Salicibibacter cibi TaxID=2743001 RepID=A0A7T6ZAI4_9BACI|nr:hypothetical protein [Salicibibacter cibi]QQK79921.1 hypothetical protein HUG20_08505 [Salicibibacter cibi]
MKEYASIETYLDILKYHLHPLPEEEKKQQINEIRDHLYEIKDKSDSSEKKTLQSFVSPEKLADDILNEHYKAKKHSLDAHDTKFKLAFVSVIAPFGPLALPILHGEFNASIAGIMTVFLLQLIVGTVSFFGYFKSNLNQQRLKYLRQGILTMLLVIALPLFFYGWRIGQDDFISTFSTIYLIIFFIIFSFYIMSLRILYKRKIINYY